MLAVPVVMLLALVAGEPALPRQNPPVVAEIRVHGNQLTPDTEVVRLAGIAVGDAFTPGLLDEARARLERDGRFAGVQVLERFASISDPSRIQVVIIVDDGPVKITVAGPTAGSTEVVKRRAITNLMAIPIIRAEDGYGVTYGVRLAYVNVLGKDGRLSFPLTWGGFRQAAVEYERRFARGPFTRVEVGLSADQQRNPAFDENDRRDRVWVRGERVMGSFRVGGDAGRERVNFAGSVTRYSSAGVDATFDTRLDPILPRNAVYAAVGWQHLDFSSSDSIQRTRVDMRGYVGLFGQTVLGVRVRREDANRPLPPFLKPLLGGWSSLRGFKAGTAVGDTLVAGSVELRIPMSSPLRVASMGVSVFVDSGKAYDKSHRFQDVPWLTGLGASVWIRAALFHAALAVAHGRGQGTRVNFGANLTY